MGYKYIDIGLNLASGKFAGDWRAVATRARSVGVDRLILTGTTVESAGRCQDLAAMFPAGACFFTAGVHPHYANSLDGDGMERLRSMLRDPRAVAVGETGLDYHRDLSSRPQQRASFRRHIELACELGKPLFLHERGAHDDFLGILDEFGPDLPPCVVHCFTGTAAQAREYVKRDFYLGITGWVGQARRNRDLLEAMPLIPIERLMLETDAPYLAPDGYKGCTPGRNEPDAMPMVAEAAAKALGIDLSDLAPAAYENTMRFFRLPARLENSGTDSLAAPPQAA